MFDIVLNTPLFVGLMYFTEEKASFKAGIISKW